MLRTDSPHFKAGGPVSKPVSDLFVQCMYAFSYKTFTVLSKVETRVVLLTKLLYEIVMLGLVHA